MQTKERTEEIKQATKWCLNGDKNNSILIVEADGILHSMGMDERQFSCGHIDFYKYVTTRKHALSRPFCGKCFDLLVEETIKAEES